MIIQTLCAIRYFVKSATKVTCDFEDILKSRGKNASEIHYETVPVISILILHFPPMIFADGTYDGKPQPVAFYLFRRTVEAVEYQPGIQRRFIGGVRYRADSSA